MSLYEILILIIIACVAVGTVVGISVYAIATLKANLKNEKERRELLEKQIEDILSNDGKMGYKDRSGIEEGQAYLLQARMAMETANEFLNAVKKGKYNPGPDDW